MNFIDQTIFHSLCIFVFVKCIFDFSCKCHCAFELHFYIVIIDIQLIYLLDLHDDFSFITVLF
ncbi:ORF089 [Staphylococcus phage 37]|uniref:ORF089 n=1 Tax=Staphylococcus phage 37 TaxID=2936813 RepID=Q4ZC93_9CAUD|nr:ORF089 [Staphylococcus phage 37]